MIEEIRGELAAELLFPRNRNAHKGDFGRVLVAAGSPGMAGSAVLCAKAAFKCGAGLVSVACERELFVPLQCNVPELICLERKDVELSRFDAVAAGPGIGVSKKSYDMVMHILTEFKGPVILDADGLNCLAHYGLPRVTDISCELTITPHSAEAARLLGLAPQDVEGNREECGRELSRMLECVAVMKGAGTLVVSGDTMLENKLGNPGMATAGSGDVLSGTILALAGIACRSRRDFPRWQVAAAGVYLHALAGDIMARKLGETGLMAGDIAQGIAFAAESLNPLRNSDFMY